MPKIVLTAGEDLVQRLANEYDPVKAVIELVWNSLDADADHVEVSFDRNEAGGIVGVTVHDDGHGMSPERIAQDFKWVGNSWKRNVRSTESKDRPMHGRYGQGRLRAFALGTRVTWTTVGIDTEGKLKCTRISSSSDHRTHFYESEPQDAEGPTWTTFKAEGRHELGKLDDTDGAILRLGAALAPHLLQYPDIEVKYDGQRINPANNIDRDTVIDLCWEHAGTPYEAKLRIIEWTNITDRSLHLCDAQGVPVEEGPKPKHTDFNYAAYVLWQDMPNHERQVQLVHMETEPSVLGALMDVVNTELAKYFEARRSERRRELVESWKTNKSYPYEGEAQTEEEQVERATFDVVATTVRRHIPKSKSQEKLTLGLLKETLQRHPDGVKALLYQYAGLTADEEEELKHLLERTPLSRLIRATTRATDRLDFLSALQHIVFNPELKGMIKERDNLHRILERESWVFGEQFNMMSSEIGLTNALRQHLRILGREPKTVVPVTKPDGSQGRLDLMFSVVAKEQDRNRHLVVELKAPHVSAGAKEASQIKDYARAIVEDPQFAGTHTVWDFMLIVTDYDKGVKKDINQRGRERGILDESELDPDSPVSYRVWVRRWSEVLEAAERRLLYYKEGLAHDPSLDDIRRYLKEHHGDVLPPDLFSDENKSTNSDSQQPARPTRHRRTHPESPPVRALPTHRDTPSGPNLIQPVDHHADRA